MPSGSVTCGFCPLLSRAAMKFMKDMPPAAAPVAVRFSSVTEWGLHWMPLMRCTLPENCRCGQVCLQFRSSQEEARCAVSGCRRQATYMLRCVFPAASNYPDSLSSLVAGYVFARAFEMCGIDVRMKWPNDLLLDDCKMAGILLEDRNGALLVGIGINVAHFPRTDCLREGAAVPACGLAARGFDFAPFELWRQLVDRAFFCYRNEVLRFSEDGLISRLEAYLAWVGRVVMIHGSDLGSCPGRLMGLSHDGALRVLLSGREQVLHSCSLSPIS